MTEQGRPELNAFGSRSTVGAHVLNQLARDLLDDNAAHGARIRGVLRNRDNREIDVMLAAIPYDVAATYAVQAVNAYSNAGKSITAVHPDQANCFPWETGFDESLGKLQPEIWGAALTGDDHLPKAAVAEL